MVGISCEKYDSNQVQCRCSVLGAHQECCLLGLCWNRPPLLLYFLLCLISCSSLLQHGPLRTVMCPEMLEYSKLWIFQHHINMMLASCQHCVSKYDLKRQSSVKWGTSDKTSAWDCCLRGTPSVWKYGPLIPKRLLCAAFKLFLEMDRESTSRCALLFASKGFVLKKRD